MTREELAQFDGRQGQKAYVAVNGKIYDFSASPLWQEGDHQGSHQAGCDLSEELRSAPHVRAVIERFPVVGDLEEPSADNDATSSNKTKTIGGIFLVIIIALLVALLR
ncbi:MAG: cytochrome B5 [Desulfuromonas sp.]|nr:MAG: cytochrome B5 [Desulfuromonas sp.]